MGHWVALSGGVGGAKLALGLARVLAPEDLTIIVNTGDDFRHLGLYIAPDLDTLMYTLAGLANPITGWGRTDESFRCLEALRALGADNWFNLGDCDLAVHLRRSELLGHGASLSAVSATLYRQLGIAQRVWPMSDDAVSTRIVTAQGTLAFQHYFVRERCVPRVLAIEFEGAARARMPQGVGDVLAAPDLLGVIVCPSNPYLSIDPILAIPALREAVRTCRAPVVAVSPLVGGQALKGPTAKIMQELGLPLSALTVAAHYRDLLDGFIVDQCDVDLVPDIEALGMSARAAPSVMLTLDDRINLAHTAVDFVSTLPR